MMMANTYLIEKQIVKNENQRTTDEKCNTHIILFDFDFVQFKVV